MTINETLHKAEFTTYIQVFQLTWKLRRNILKGRAIRIEEQNIQQVAGDRLDGGLLAVSKVRPGWLHCLHHVAARSAHHPCHPGTELCG